MADGALFDFSEINQMAADLGVVADNAGPNIHSAIRGTSLGVKKSWQQPLRGSKTLPQLPYAISFDITTAQLFGTSVIKSEIGFDKEKPQGALGNVSEYGTPSITGRGFGLKALEDNQEDFQRGLDIALKQAERKGNL